MSTLFKGPPKPTPERAEPQTNDEDLRRAKLKKITEMDKASGASGNQLTESKLGDYSSAITRTGAGPQPKIITGT
jgi:hypothetical protein